MGKSKKKVLQQPFAKIVRQILSSYLNKLVDQYSNTYHYSIGKRPINADYFAWSKGIESSHKALKFTVGGRVRIISKYKNIFSKGYTKNWSRNMLLILC